MVDLLLIKDQQKFVIWLFLYKKQFAELTAKVCVYCGEYTKEKNFSGLDRIDNNLGYFYENCVSCCERYNFLKRDFNFKEIEALYQGWKRLLNNKY